MTLKNDDPLIGGYTLEMHEAQCRPGQNAWSTKLALEQDISEALPYLNRVFDAEFYDHSARALTFHTDGRHYAARPHELCIAPVENREDAEAAAREMVEKINRIWADRASIEPRLEGKTKPNLMDLYRNLPRTNCGQCGCPSCMAFAAALREGEAQPEDCPPLDAPEHAEKKAKLLELFSGGG